MIADYWEHAAFPFELVPRMAKLNLGGATIKGYGCPGQSVLGTAMAVIEIARVDASMSTFIMVHNSLAMLTIGALPPQAGNIFCVARHVGCCCCPRSCAHACNGRHVTILTCRSVGL